jgi:hypothetical protein
MGHMNVWFILMLNLLGDNVNTIKKKQKLWVMVVRRLGQKTQKTKYILFVTRMQGKAMRVS